MAGTAYFLVLFGVERTWYCQHLRPQPIRRADRYERDGTVLVLVQHRDPFTGLLRVHRATAAPIPSQVPDQRTRAIGSGEPRSRIRGKRHLSEWYTFDRGRSRTNRRPGHACAWRLHPAGVLSTRDRRRLRPGI